MTICVESCIGREGGAEGVKPEQQVLITEGCVELLSRFPFEDALLTRACGAPKERSKARVA